jgi:chromosome partitioning protein
MKVISIVGLKGGSGKTSTAVPLAWQASLAGPTAILDLDPTPSASQWVEAADMTSDNLVAQRLDPRDLSATMRDVRRSGAIEYVVIDTPPVARDVCMQTAGVADLVVIPVHIGSGDLAQLVQTLDLMELPRRGRPELPIVVVLNHAGTMPALARETRATIEADEVVQELGVKVAATEIPYLKLYATAKGAKPGVKWWHYEKLWTELRGLL